jgi:hypothetical protein
MSVECALYNNKDNNINNVDIVIMIIIHNNSYEHKEQVLKSKGQGSANVCEKEGTLIPPV